MANALAALVVMAILVEVCVDILKAAIPYISGYRSQLTSMILGITLTVATATGLLTMLGISLNMLWLDWFLTGLIISRGSNFVHDLLTRLRQYA